ncbi:hypothetical protein [Paenibacillus validus]|uniref:hypothetical protein n=1 Tax=Paenibacillus validus TaxID=44253 RepID=UPI003D2CFFBE
MQLQGESGKLAPIFELFPRLREEIDHLLQQNSGHIEDVAIDYDGDSVFCGFVIRHDGGEIGIDFFSITQTLFVDFRDRGQLPTSYRLDFDENPDIASMMSVLESQIRALELSPSRYDQWFSGQLNEIDLREMKEQLEGLKRRSNKGGLPQQRSEQVELSSMQNRCAGINRVC